MLAMTSGHILWPCGKIDSHAEIVHPSARRSSFGPRNLSLDTATTSVK